jgi:hypothetical protein
MGIRYLLVEKLVKTLVGQHVLFIAYMDTLN